MCDKSLPLGRAWAPNLVGILCAAFLLITPLLATAAGPSVEVDRCLQAAAAKHGVNYVLVRAIAEQESSFNPHAVRQPLAAGNLDSSTDYGLMQINSSWLPTLKRYGVTASQLFQPCINADVGAWILANNFKRLGVTWNAVGAYNAQTQWKRMKYAAGIQNKVLKTLRFQTQNLPAPTQFIYGDSGGGVTQNQSSTIVWASGDE